MKRGWRLALAVGLAACALAAAPARAETRRLAVIVGHNLGSGARPPLRFAEQDAVRMAAVLEELGDFRRGDVFVLRGPTLEAARRALAVATARVAAWRATSGTQAVVVFYFSGHSDGAILELGREALPFGEVRRWLERTGADVRIGIIDTCKSGALLAAKGGTLAPAFDIRLAESLSSTGDALITSSAASEVALESSEIGASFFSHHLVSGLRGAADLSGDGLVTLAEAYQYAFGRTVSATADTIIGPQHPGYDFRLSGRGDIVLTGIRRPSAAIDVPRELERVVIGRAEGLEVVAEVAGTTARRIALSPGRYQVRGWRGGENVAAELTLAAGEIRPLLAGEMRGVIALASSPKGGGAAGGLASGPMAAEAHRWRLFLGGGVQSRGLSQQLDQGIPSLRLAVRGPGWRAPAVALDLARGHYQHFRLDPTRTYTETHAQVLVGMRIAGWSGRFEVGAGGFAGGGLALQQVDQGRVHWSALATVAPCLGARMLLWRRTALALEAQLPLTLVQVDGDTRLLPRAVAWLGLEVRL